LFSLGTKLFLSSATEVLWEADKRKDEPLIQNDPRLPSAMSEPIYGDLGSFFPTAFYELAEVRNHRHSLIRLPHTDRAITMEHLRIAQEH
jgi:hypothetical protein